MEKTVYSSCLCNCGSNSHCIFKVHVRDGKVVRVEPDDRYNTGVGREDEVLSDRELIKTHLQRRPCTKGLVFYRYIYHPDRILYPLKRAPGAKRGEGKFVRISWDEALDTIADRMKRAREEHGPYSVITPYMPNESAERLFSFWGAGVDSWGWCSYDSVRMMAHIVAGEKGWDYSSYCSGSAADMLAHAKLIILWGLDASIGSSGPGYQFAYFLKLARERGVKVIIFDPRYTASAEVLANQWIPIKPGSDRAMYMALCYIMFRKDTWNKAFVARYVESEGFERWRKYIMGEEDGVAKTPEWAETKCAVPAETIRAIGDLIDKVRPAWLWSHWVTSRRSRGEDTVRAFSFLQAMMGYWGMPGAGPAINLGPIRLVPTQVSWGEKGGYEVPKMYRSHYWAQAVLLLDRLRDGSLSKSDYIRMVGYRADPALLDRFNPRVLFWGGGSKPHASDHLVTSCGSAGEEVKAMERMDFIVTMHSIMTASAKYSDIILPAQDWMWEEKNIARTGGYGGFDAINYCPGVVSPPGEVKPWAWVYTKLAERLGIDPRKFFRYYTDDKNWERDWERYVKDGYGLVENYYRQKGISVPVWERFKEGEFINCDELDEEPFTGFEPQLKHGKPFQTASGKIEFYSKYVANEANRGKGAHYDSTGRLYDNLPGDWGSLTPMATYQTAVRGMDDPLVEKYPLMLICPHCRYRVHYLFWDHPWLRDHIYRHRVWVNVVDAGIRGIRDNDLVMVYNDQGTVVMPAYVTSRVMPGVTVIHHGGKYLPDRNGVDFGATPSTLLGGDFESCITPAKAASVVQIKKYDGVSR
jgi:anaerobic dimethyl sulfoxide reductase subunit A